MHHPSTPLLRPVPVCLRRRHRSILLFVALGALLLLPPAAAEDTLRRPGEPRGQVEIPIEVYNALVEASRDPRQPPRPVPERYALGAAQVNLNVGSGEPRAVAQVGVSLSVDIFEEGWVLIPVLPAGTAVERATVGGQPIQLVPTAEGLAWITETAGSHTLQLSYRVDASASAGGYSLPVPLPAAAALRLIATLPGTGLDVSVIPAAGLQQRESGGSTHLDATLPTSRGVQIAWRTPGREGHTLSRARYVGRLTGEAVTWNGTYDLELFSDEGVTLPLLPRDVTLADLKLDGESAAILVEGGHFATPVRGRGRHLVEIEFETPVVRGDGPPRVELRVSEVPVSRFDLELPGRKEVTVTPAANVTARQRDGGTTATVFAPMTGRLAFAWAEAVPDDVKAKARANASLYHTLHAEEGVLDVRAFALWEITRGETSLLELEVPPEVQVNRITSDSGAVADWRIEAGDGQNGGAGTQRVSVFLDRKVRGEILLEVDYDRSLPAGDEDPLVTLPLLRAADAHRQRGMVALLSSQDLTLEPVEEAGATRVGENQLPAFVGDALSMTVAHTFKYVETPPRLVVEAVEPEREQGRFDTQVDTLVSLGEVTLAGSASLEVHVKSGALLELVLDAPPEVNILDLSGPSVRSHQVRTGDDGQQIEVEFTQEMEGQFRLEVGYEQILGDLGAELEVPILSVAGSEVEQGRIAVEALSAAEVRPLASDQLTTLEVGELPRHLVLRTTNPILLAYKYVRSGAPHRLALGVTRHQLLEVQEAAIDRAEYTTLYTRDGLAVTTARFLVRNARKQFLRVRLPAEADIWSAFVDGRAEKPAIADDDPTKGDDPGGKSVLLKIVNSTRGFPVQLIFATPQSKIGGLGKVEGILPRPDILVTQSRWDVFLPADMRYGTPDTNMDRVHRGGVVNAEQLQARLAAMGEGVDDSQVIEPLHIAVPTAGVHFGFEKLYANQGDEDAWFTLTFASAVGSTVGLAINLVATLLLWFGVVLGVRSWTVSRRPALALVAIAIALFALTHGLWGVSLELPFWLSVFALAVAGVARLVMVWRGRREVEAEG